MDIRVNSHVEGGCNEGFGEIDNMDEMLAGLPLPIYEEPAAYARV